MARLRVSLGSPKRFNYKVLNLDGVQRVMDRVTREIEGESRGRLARHRKTGNHRVFAYRDRHTRVVVLEGEASMSVQFGHHTANGLWVKGIYILPTAGRREG